MKRHPPHPPVLGGTPAGPAGAERRRGACRPAPEVLDAGHPLCRTLSALQAASRHALTVAPMLGVGAVASAAGAAWAPPLTAAAGAVLLTLAAAAGVLVANRAAHARALIEQGDEHMPIAAVRRERDRLLDPRRRGDLARTLDRIARRAGEPRPPGPVTAPYHPRTIAAAAADLRAIAEIVRSGPQRARGVAAAHRLVTDGASPLYGADPHALRTELQRIRFLLHD